MKSLNEINAELCTALGVDTKWVSKVVLTIEGGKLPTVEVTKHVMVACEFKKVLQKYRLVEVVQPCHKCSGNGLTHSSLCDKSGELDDDHPLVLVNSQICDLLEGIGANEDHEDVISFLLSTGLPSGTVNRIHRALVCAEVKSSEAGG